MPRCAFLIKVSPLNPPIDGPVQVDLTRREVQVWRLIAYGGTQKEIADALRIGPKSVAKYTFRIKTKVGSTAWGGRVELARLAVKHGVVNLKQWLTDPWPSLAEVAKQPGGKKHGLYLEQSIK